MELQNKKTQSFQQWTNKVVPGQSIFHSKFQKFMKNLVLSRSRFSSKWSSGQVKGSSDDRAEFLHQKSDIFCVESKCFWKTLTLSSRNPIFHRMFVCTRKLHFWRLCRNFWAKYGRSSYWNPESGEKIRKCWKKISKWSSRIRKRSLFNSEQTRLFLVKVFFTLSFKNIWKT